ncbi:MAG: class I SAM-dependent methyltransferase [Nanoarchaeota archaeon]
MVSISRKWSFEYQWEKYHTRELTYGMSSEQEFEKFCHDLQIRPHHLKGKRILDAGCGSGRLTRVVAEYAKEAYGVDLIKLPRDSKVKFVRADIQKLPFKKGYFDYVYCEGVLHHTPHPKQAFMELARVNKGRLFVMLYSHRNIFMKIRCYFFTYRYPHGVLRVISLFLALLFFIPMNIYKIIFNRDKSYTLSSLDFFIFDYISPLYQSVHGVEEVKGWFKEAGYRHIVQVSKRDTEVLGVK